MIHINIGSNLKSNFGSKIENIIIAINLLVESKIKINKVSKFYETPSYPNQNFPKFVNVGINLDFKNDCLQFLKIINLIEKKIGRIKTKKNNPRVIDIDIIDFKGMINNSKNLILPHPRAHLRNFVLYPIMEIEPNWSHPIFKKNAQFLINKLSQKSRIEITRLQKNVNISYD
jgi:2-amino-4-hydroxy-6-hydroxymethyldihydropteridine diphosphokinase